VATKSKIIYGTGPNLLTARGMQANVWYRKVVSNVWDSGQLAQSAMLTTGLSASASQILAMETYLENNRQRRHPSSCYLHSKQVVER
jgi:hypothetical protein